MTRTPAGILALACLAMAPGVFGALGTDATGEGFALALLADLLVAVLVAPALSKTNPPGTWSSEACDLAAWFGGAAALAGTTLLSSPMPRWLGGDGPVRHACLAAGGVVAASSVLLALVRPRRSDAT